MARHHRMVLRSALQQHANATPTSGSHARIAASVDGDSADRASPVLQTGRARGPPAAHAIYKDPEPEHDGNDTCHDPSSPVLSDSYRDCNHQSPGGCFDVSTYTSTSPTQPSHGSDKLEYIEIMKDCLEDLFSNADKLLRKITPESLSSFRAPRAHRAIWESRIKSLNGIIRRDFRASEFIDLETVRSIFASEHQLHEPHRAHQLSVSIYKANLAVFANRIFTASGDIGAFFKDMLLDDTFPRNFMDSLQDGASATAMPQNSRLVKETFELALDMRTQLAVYLLVHGQGEGARTPIEIIQEVFYEPADEDVPEGAALLRGWQLASLDLSGDDTSEEYKMAILQRIGSIKQYVQGDFVDAARLKSEYPWTVFIERAWRWVDLRNCELKAHPITFGDAPSDIGTVEKRLEDGVAGTSGNDNSTAFQSRIAPTVGAGPDSQRSPHEVLGSVQVLKRRLARISSERSRAGEDATVTTRAPRSAIPPGREDDNQPSTDEENEDPETLIDPSTESSAMLDDLVKLRQRKKRIGKSDQSAVPQFGVLVHRSFYDRQPTATRVSFEEPDALSSDEPAQSTNGHDRRSRDETESDSEDDMFETSSSVKRRKAPVQKAASYIPPSARPSVEPTQNQSDLEDTDAAGSESVGSDGDASPSPAGQLKLARQLASARHKRVARPGNRRAPWSSEEDVALLRLFAKHRDKSQVWIAIKKEDEEDHDILRRRTNVDIKDRHRNIGARLKRNRQPMPDHLKLPTQGSRR